MHHLLHIEENGLHLTVRVTEEGDVRLLHFSTLPWSDTNAVETEMEPLCRMVEVHVSGENPHTHHGSEH